MASQIGCDGQDDPARPATPGEGGTQVALGEPVDDELARWKEATQSVIDEWIASNAGDFPTQELYDRMVELAGS